MAGLRAFSIGLHFASADGRATAITGPAMKTNSILPLLAVLAALGLAGPVPAADVHAAVAANFTVAAKEIGVAFERKTGDKAILSFGSTGQLTAQIFNGAPFEIFLSADVAHPASLERDGFVGSHPRFTYAVGKLVLWSADPQTVDGKGAVLAAGTFAKLAVTNPKSAPYGTAAMEAIEKLGLTEALRPKLVFGQNVSQTQQFISTGNAQLGFVALAQVINDASGSMWVVPETLYAPIRQQAVLLKKGDANPAAKAFVNFLQGPEAGAILGRYGYGVEKPAS